jgi:precorrin-8X/cobalt-precorrin-8 methylmutase
VCVRRYPLLSIGVTFHSEDEIFHVVQRQSFAICGVGRPSKRVTREAQQLILVESGDDEASELSSVEIRTQAPSQDILGGQLVVVIFVAHLRSPFGPPPSVQHHCGGKLYAVPRAGKEDVSRAAHPIEIESYRILRSQVDTAGLSPGTRAVTERIIHASADLDYATDLVCDEDALHAGHRALASGAPLVVDVRMLAAGITSRQCVVALDLARDSSPGLTRSAAGIRVAAAEYPEGAVWAVGNAPTALRELIRLAATGVLRPALVIGLPVGFVDAAQAKAALRDSALPALSNRSAKGGTAVAAAAVNALLCWKPVQ